jgi:tRNA A-37 threonylcarbamoyl transferase component Bud32
MNGSFAKLYMNSLYRKKEFNQSKFHDKLNKRKKRSNSISTDRKNSPENKNKYLLNTLYKKRANNSVKRFDLSNIKRKNINIKASISNKNYLYNKLNTSFPFYNLNYEDLHFNLNDIIYFNDESIIYKGKYFHNEICIKEIKNIHFLSEKEQDKIQMEIVISLLLHHKNIVNTLGYSFNQQRTKIFIVSEYMNNDSLKSFIESNKGNISLKQKLLFIYEIALGIEYMHTSKYKILHRDIKSSNILLDNNLHCKICDFGMSKCLNMDNNTLENNTSNISTNYQTNSQSTLFWMSPEYLCDGIINDKSDIYSFGILIWEIFMEDTNPYKNININDYFLGVKDIVYNKRPVVDDKYFKEVPEMKKLMELMWNKNYNERPDIGYILKLLEELNKKFSFL